MIGEAIYPHVAPRIVAAREKAGRSRGYVADRVKISHVDYAMIERGKSRYRLHVLYSIADAIEVDVRTLLVPNTNCRAQS